MRKFVLSVLVSIVMAIGLVSARPLVINADATDGEFDNDSVVGVQVQENEELLSGVQGTRYTFNIILDGFYVGEFNIHVEYDSYNLDSSDWDHYTINRTVYVCGYDTYFETWMRSNWLPPSSITWSASVNNSDQCIYVGRMDSTQLLQILTQFKNTYSTNSNVTNGFLNQLDQKIDQLISLRQFNFPIESLPAIIQINQQINPVDILNTNYYSYPIFNVNTSTLLFKNYYVNQERYDTYIICMGNFSISNINRINNYFSFSTNEIELSEFQIINVFKDNNNTFWYTIKFRLHLTSSQDQDIQIYPKSSFKFIPIYYNRVNLSNYVSTDFALLYGLSNQLLNDLHIIAQGTQQSNSSSSDLEDSANEYGEVADDVLGLEDDLGSGFSSSLNNVPTTFNFSTQFGNKFLHSATWVRNQFETLTTNTPFGALITFSLVLGLALLLVGRRLL